MSEPLRFNPAGATPYCTDSELPAMVLQGSGQVAPDLSLGGARLGYTWRWRGLQASATGTHGLISASSTVSTFQSPPNRNPFSAHLRQSIALDSQIGRAHV